MSNHAEIKKQAQAFVQGLDQKVPAILAANKDKKSAEKAMKSLFQEALALIPVDDRPYWRRQVALLIASDKISNHEKAFYKALAESSLITPDEFFGFLHAEYTDAAPEATDSAPEATDSAFTDLLSMPFELEKFLTAALVQWLNAGFRGGEDTIWKEIETEAKKKFPVLFKHHEYPELVDAVISVFAGVVSAALVLLYIAAQAYLFLPSLAVSILRSIDKQLLSVFDAYDAAVKQYENRAYIKAALGHNGFAPDGVAFTDDELDEQFNTMFHFTEKTQDNLLFTKKINTDNCSPEQKKVLFQKEYVKAYYEAKKITYIAPLDTDHEIAKAYAAVRAEQAAEIRDAVNVSGMAWFQSIVDAYMGLFTPPKDLENDTTSLMLFYAEQTLKVVAFSALVLCVSLPLALLDEGISLMRAGITYALLALKLVSACILSLPLYLVDGLMYASENFSPEMPEMPEMPSTANFSFFNPASTGTGTGTDADEADEAAEAGYYSDAMLGID